MYFNTARKMSTEQNDAKLYLYFSDVAGPCLTGNKAGLAHLSDVIKNVSDAKMPGEHAHLYAENDILCGGSQPLTIYFEDDEWFEKYATENDEPDARTEDVPQRKLQKDQLAAFMIATEIPPEMNLRKGKIYKIISVSPYPDEEAWQKTIREDEGRMIVVSFYNEKNEIEKCAFDCDDEEIVFYENKDIEQLL